MFCVQIQVELEHIDTSFTKEAELAFFEMGKHQRLQLIGADPRAFATRGIWNSAEAGEMSGSRPEPEEVTMSEGMASPGFSC